MFLVYHPGCPFERERKQGSHLGDSDHPEQSCCWLRQAGSAEVKEAIPLAIHFAGCIVGGSGDRIQDKTLMGNTGDLCRLVRLHLEMKDGETIRLRKKTRSSVWGTSI